MSTVRRLRCARTPEKDEATIWFAPVATATAGDADENQKRRDQEPAANPEETGKQADHPAQTQKEKGVDRKFGDREVDLHLDPTLGVAGFYASQAPNP